MLLTSNPRDTRPPILSDTLGTITPIVGTASTTINVTEGIQLNNDYPNGLFDTLKNGWQLDTRLFCYVPSITFTGTNYGTITVNQVLNAGNVPIAQRTFYTTKQGWLLVPLSLHQYPDDATTLSLVVSVVLPSGSVIGGSCKLFLGM